MLSRSKTGSSPAKANEHKCEEKDQYCLQCKKFMCTECREEHSIAYEEHQISDIHEICSKLVTKYKKIAKELIKGQSLESEEENLNTDLKENLSDLDDAKKEITEYIAKMVDEIFKERLENKIKDIKEQSERMLEEQEKLRKETEKVEKESNRIKSLGKDPEKYEEIAKLYDEEYKSTISVLEHAKKFEKLKNDAKKLEIEKTLEKMKESITNKTSYTIKYIINGGGACKKCQKNIYSDEELKTMFLTNEICKNCNASLDYTWKNGEKIFKGTSGKWETFCTEKILPEYFKVRVKIHKEWNPADGKRFVGISKNPCDSEDKYYSASKEYYALSNKSGVWRNKNHGKSDALAYGKDGDVVTIIYDRKKNLDFEVNDKSVEDIVENIDGPFYLACADASGGEYEIMEVTPLS